MNTFRIRLREQMDKQNLNVNDVAEYCCVSDQAVYAWLSGRNVPTIINAMMLADLTDVSIDYLVGRDDRNARGEGLEKEKTTRSTDA